MNAPLRHRAALLVTLVVMAVVLAAGQTRDAPRAPVSTASISGTGVVHRPAARAGP